MKPHTRVKEIERICDYHFEREDLALSALTHPSAVEGKPVSASYERLEFLGDSLLGAIVASALFARFPSMDEGGLSRIKTSLVSGKTLARVGEELGYGSLIRFGTSERGSGARGMRKALEDVYEALVGAIYIDGGLEAATEFVTRTVLCYATPTLAERPLSPKSRLQEVAQRDYKCGPSYKLVHEEGPAHTPTFTSVALIEGRRVGRGKGPSKKESEAAAALDALQNLGYVGARQIDGANEHATDLPDATPEAGGGEDVS
ncbi:MAG: ribonuclease III [Coriobacteriales bacterium]|nr:ribonuclease III [Coriobacteriales bacterium]